MGILLSKFRKEKWTTTIILEQLEENIIKLENSIVNTQKQKRLFVHYFLGISIGIYVVSFLLLYFFYLPPTWGECIMYLVVLLLFPFIIHFIRKLFAWYFQRKLNKNSDKLRALKVEKKKILDLVLDIETYNVAVYLLERFGDEIVGGLSIGNQLIPPSNTPQLFNTTVASDRSVHPNNLQQATTPAIQTYAGQVLRRRTPFPIVDSRNLSALDRNIEPIVGDSPHEHFAMICKDCFGHNSMGTKDDYDYTTFRCVYCNKFNSSRKTLPIALRLGMERFPIDSVMDSSSNNHDDVKEDRVQLPPPSTATETDQNEATATLEKKGNIPENKMQKMQIEKQADTKTNTLERLSQSEDDESNAKHAATANALNVESTKELCTESISCI